MPNHYVAYIKNCVYIGIGIGSVSADFNKILLVIYRIGQFKKWHLSVLIGIGQYEKKLIGCTLTPAHSHVYSRTLAQICAHLCIPVHTCTHSHKPKRTPTTSTDPSIPAHTHAQFCILTHTSAYPRIFTDTRTHPHTPVHTNKC